LGENVVEVTGPRGLVVGRPKGLLDEGRVVECGVSFEPKRGGLGDGGEGSWVWTGRRPRGGLVAARSPRYAEAAGEPIR